MLNCTQMLKQLSAEACAKTERSEATQNDARSAFILAAVEAGIYFEVQ
jgi:hypothetical protein